MHPAHVINEPQAGLIICERQPVNLEYPFDQLGDFLTPNDLFSVRRHFKAPEVDSSGYVLRIEGAVRQPISIRYEDLLTMPSVTLPQVEGAQWQRGAVGTAEWAGVPLSKLLDRAGLAKDACEIVFQAADKGMAKEKPLQPGEISYARSIPIEKAKDVLIAYSMNGEPIPADHGFPLRAIVPAHYGMASIKWLTHIRVVRAPFSGYWQTSDYAWWDDADNNPVRRPLDLMALKSSIARPRVREFVPAGHPHPVFGAAWDGDAPLEQIELSTDNRTCRQAAHFLDLAQPFVWRHWDLDWQVPQTTGSYTLRVRDATGRVQPDSHNRSFGSCVIHHTAGVEVLVH